ncbi:hypothetical protein NIA73_01430 [Anaerobutyricum hallii]|nr:hypothetical protein [Anaerobutyricum hallii]
MPEWLFDFLSGPTIKIAEAIWNSSMRLIIKLVCSTPQKFSTGTWAFVKENLYPWAEGIGLSALNLFFMIAFLKAVSNLHQNITLEMVIEAMIKVVVANVLYLNILNIMTTIFSISSAMAKEVFTIDAPDLKSRGYGYWLSIVLSAIWLALYTGSDRLQLFDVMDSI